MTIYFGFSDENGDYQILRSNRFKSAHPYYVRSTMLINASDWKSLETAYREIKSKYNLPLNKEVKWSYLRSIYKYRKNGKNISEREPFYFLREFPTDEHKRFLLESLGILCSLETCKLIFTVTCNTRCPRIDEKRLIKMHIQEAMQRIEMEIQHKKDNLCVLFVDPVSNRKDRVLRDAYSELYQNGDIIERYGHIKDSLNIEHSHHSVGIQMSDFLAGSFVSALKGYDFGTQIYSDIVSKLVRRNSDGRVGGYGIREVPGNKQFREELVGVCA